MEPFAYQPPRRPFRIWLALGTAAITFAVWHFNLLPQFVPVETGRVEPVAPEIGDHAMSAELWDDIVDHRSDHAAFVDTPSDGDPLLSAIATQHEPIDAAFLEFDRSPLAASAAGQEPQDLTPPQTRRTSDGGAFAGNNVSPVSASNDDNTANAASYERHDFDEAPTNAVHRVLPPEIAAALNQADKWIAEDEILQAHAELSQIYWKQPELRSLLTERLEVTAAEIYANPKRHFAEPYFVEYGDTLERIAEQYSVTWQYLAQLNGTTPKTLQAGQQLKVLRGPFGAVVDLSNFELTVHAHGWYVHRYRIGTGKDNRTPTGEFTVRNKLENPTWYNPDGGQVDGDDPSNPLGEYWLGLGDHIGIHGTIDPGSIGRAASRGCIHLADGDIEEVFNLLGVGSKVLIRE